MGLGLTSNSEDGKSRDGEFLDADIAGIDVAGANGAGVDASEADITGVGVIGAGISGEPPHPDSSKAQEADNTNNIDTGFLFMFKFSLLNSLNS